MSTYRSPKPRPANLDTPQKTNQNHRMDTPLSTDKGLKKTKNFEQAEHFAAKEKWKNLPGNRYDLTKAGPPPKLEIVTKPLPGGLVLDWI